MQMARKIMAKNLFRPIQNETKAGVTDKAYRVILTAQEQAREEKTERLRRARERKTQVAFLGK